MKSGKAWGATHPIELRESVEVHHISVKLGGFCSKHCHHIKHNTFYVVSGKLLVKVWKHDYPLVDETTLGPGESMTVAPGEYHQFEGLAETEAIEIYHVNIDPNDIARDSHGGLINGGRVVQALYSERD